MRRWNRILARALCLTGLAACLAACLAGSASAQTYDTLAGGRAQLAPSAVTPRFELDAVRPELHKWYVPRHLPQVFDSEWYQSQTSYARDAYRYYVSAELEGLLWFDHFGQPVERGWLIYEWQQEQEHPRGSSIWKGREYQRLFRNLVVASEVQGATQLRLMLGDELHTVFTPLTFSKPRFDGLRLDGAGERLQGSLILARPSNPDVDNVQGTLSPSDRTDFVNLFGGHGEWNATPSAVLGATYVNAHFGQTREPFGSGSPFSGSLTTDQNQSLETLWVRLRDDSPEDGTGGAILYDAEIVLTDTAGTVLRGRDIGFLPTVEGGLARGSALVADGSESITIGWDLATLSADGTETEDLERVQVELSVANDYVIEIASNVQTDGEIRRAAPVFLTARRAPGNVQDQSNAAIVTVDYGLPTATEVIGVDWNLTDWHGLSVQGEWAVSRRHRQYPNPGLNGRHRMHTQDVAAYTQARYEAHPWSLFGEVFHIADGYDTGAYLIGDYGKVHYDDPTQSRYEFVDDDDDANTIPEWDRPFQRSSDVAWPGLDENADFLNDHNQNDNLIPDYEEPFLRFRSDRPEFLPGLDMNYNGVTDRFENDGLADYPYKADHRGVNVYGTVHAGPDASLSVGRQRQRLISGDGRTDADYALARLNWKRAGLRVRYFQQLARVRDDIADPLRLYVITSGTAGRMRDVEDPLMARDTWVHSAYVDVEHRIGDAVRLEHKGRWQWYQQRDDDEALLRRELRRHAGFAGLIDRAEWRIPVGLSVLETRWKSELRHQRPAEVLQREGTSLQQILFLIWTQPLLAESTTVAYFPRYGRQLFSSELQLGLELSRLWLLDGRLIDVEEDVESWAAVAQLTNRSAYLGYQMVTRIGLQVGRRHYETLGTERLSSFFLTVHAGLR